MPIYEYRCQQCGEVFEILQRFSDPQARTCSHCSGILEKLISRTSFQLKGKGWYVTDYSDRYRSSKSASKSAAPSKDTASTSASESSGSKSGASKD